MSDRISHGNSLKWSLLLALLRWNTSDTKLLKYFLHKIVEFMHVCMYVCIHVRVYACVCTCVCVCISICVFILATSCMPKLNTAHEQEQRSLACIDAMSRTNPYRLRSPILSRFFFNCFIVICPFAGVTVRTKK